MFFVCLFFGLMFLVCSALLVMCLLWLPQVVSVLGRMERLRSVPLHANVCTMLDRHLEAIYSTQARRREELQSSSTRQRPGAALLNEDRGKCSIHRAYYCTHIHTSPAIEAGVGDEVRVFI